MTIAQCLDGDISLGSLILNTKDENGVVWLVTDIEGWWTLPDNEFNDVARGWDDGSYDTTGRYTARNLTLNGVIIPASPTQLAVARAALVGNVDLCRKSAWLITREPTRTVGSVVRLSGQPLINTVNDSGRTEFSVGLRASDPVKYSLAGDEPPGWYEEVQIGPGLFPVENEGNYQVFPTLTISGPTAGPVRVTIETATRSATLVVAGLVAAGTDLVIDIKNRSASLVTGTTVTRNKRTLLRWDTGWPILWPGVNSVEFAPYEPDSTPAAADAAELTVSWRHGWIA
jgi:hypothetical protein